MEWIVFAGFALFIWWRLVKDDYRRSLEEDEDAERPDGTTQPDREPTQPNEIQQKVQP